MFDKVEYRYLLRAALVGVAGVLVSIQASSAGTSLSWGEVGQAFIAGALAALAYAGIGAAVPVVEPSIGNKLEG